MPRLRPARLGTAPAKNEGEDGEEAGARASGPAAGVNSVYSQDEGGDVRRAGAQCGDRLQFVVVQLSVRTKTKRVSSSGAGRHRRPEVCLSLTVQSADVL